MEVLLQWLKGLAYMPLRKKAIVKVSTTARPLPTQPKTDKYKVIFLVFFFNQSGTTDTQKQYKMSKYVSLVPHELKASQVGYKRGK